MSFNAPPAFHGQRPELLILDVDGVLTTNVVYLGDDGREWKPFFVPDGTGIRLLQRVGVGIALLSGRASEATHRRARELDIEWHLSGISDKREATRRLIAESGASRETTVYVGDDLIDLPAMAEVGLPVAVPNGRPEVRSAAVAITEAAGGEGAVREVCEWILDARGEREQALERYQT